MVSHTSSADSSRGRDRVDAGPVLAGPDRERVLGVPPGVQDLQCDEPAGLVHGRGDDPVRLKVGGVVEDLGVLLQAALGVG
jgi:hypothetical protein